MKNIKSVAVFYSHNSNLILANSVRNALSNLKIHTVYSNDIDEIILKNFSSINYLILDFTKKCLDNRSLELLLKLRENGFIKQIVLIRGKIEVSEGEFDLILNEFDLGDKLKTFIIKKEENKKNDYFNEKWVSIIGENLIDLGFSLKHYGYLLLIRAISFYLSTNSNVKSLNKNLYPFLANTFLTQESNIEMCLRTAIKYAYKKNKIKGNFNCCPTIKEFLNFATTYMYKVCYDNNI